jgi:hypothetical protein
MESWFEGRKTGLIVEIYSLLNVVEYFFIVPSMLFVIETAVASSMFPEIRVSE